MRVLFVDDDPMILDVYKKEFEHFFPEYDSYFALNGLEAFKLLEKFNIDLLITDAKMPIMGGIELAQKTRGLKNKPKSLCLITGFSGSLEELGDVEVFDKIYHKPVNFDRLVKYIKETNTCLEISES